ATSGDLTCTRVVVSTFQSEPPRCIPPGSSTAGSRHSFHHRPNRYQCARGCCRRSTSVTRLDPAAPCCVVDRLIAYIGRAVEPTVTPVPQPKETTMADDITLDVRDEIPARRHELIFQTYHGLDNGTAFVLVNDHDPKPLYYQFEAEHTGQFTWQ